MKNIIIVGVPRSGKSTLARMIMKKFGNYNIISGDIIKSAFISACIDKEEKIIKLDIASKQILSCFSQSIYYEKPLNYILDVSLMKLSKFENFKDCIIIVLGYPDLSPDKLFKNIRKYECIYDWTYTESDSRIRKCCYHFVDHSKYYEEECKKMNLPFYNVSEGREKVFEKILDELEDKIYE